MNYPYLSDYKLKLENTTFLSDEIKRFYSFSIKYYKDKLDKRTIYLFVRHIEAFEKFMYFEYPNINSLIDLKEDHLIQFKTFCRHGLKNSKKTINSKLTSLKYFFNYLYEQSLIPYNFVLNVKKFKLQTKYTPTYFQSSDLKVIFSEMRTNIYGSRDISICKFILTTGVDINEVLNIRLESIDFNNKTFNINDKIYPLGDNLLIELKNYLSVRSSIDKNKSKYLFLSRSGTPYSIRSFERFFKKALTNTNYYNLSPKFLKTTFLVNMARVSNIEQLKILTNQTKLDHYYKLLDNPLQNII